MDAQQLSAQAGVYGGDLPGSEAGLEALVAKAPGNVGLRLAQADMYRAAICPGAPKAFSKETEAQAPRDIGLEVSQAYTAMDLQEWRQLDVLTDDVVARNPDNRQVQRLSRLRDVHDMAELRVEAYTGKSFGGGNDSEAGAVSGAVTGASKAVSTRRLSTKTGACLPVPAMPAQISKRVPASIVGRLSAWSGAPVT